MADLVYQSETAIELAAAWKKAVAGFLRAQENVIRAQIEISTKTQEIGDRWLGRMQSNANLTSEFVSKLAAARSMRDTAAAWQEWGAQWLRMVAEDPQLLLTDSEKIGELAKQVFANSWLSLENWPTILAD